MIAVEHLGKRYRLGGREQYYRTLREGLVRALSMRGRRERGDEHIWALKDVSFEVAEGEVLGIIGRNGAGKSTLLKILSRVTRPTEGRARLYGRSGSLLEVGTGFHPELTGRENIFLSGNILGMTRAEVRAKFDEIVAFSELEQFLDTPVKRYSSGMYVRLGFAVAAHLDPEILIVDEVLAVGDAGFQRKCLGKMEDAAQSGRTVLFVSHNMTAVQGLCSRALLLEAGRIHASGPVDEIVTAYEALMETRASQDLSARTDRRGDGRLRFVSFCQCNAAGQPSPHVCCGEDCSLELSYASADGRPLRDVHVAVAVRGRFGQPVTHLSTTVKGFEFEEVPGRGRIVCRLKRLPLRPGRYPLVFFSRVGGRIADWVVHAAVLHVEAGDFFGMGRLPPDTQGPLLLDHAWEVQGDAERA